MSTVPTDFSGPILEQPNPAVVPHWDTDAPSDVAKPVDASISTGNYHAPRITKTPSTDYERIEKAPLGHPELSPVPAGHSRTVKYPTGHVIAFPDHMSPEEFDKAARAAWAKIREQ